MNTPFSPHTIIPETLIRMLRTSSAEAERSGRLTEAQLSVIYGERWLRMFLPESLGGSALSLPDGLRLQEALAWVDGSLGWTVTLCSGATMFAAYLEPDLARRLLIDPDACFGGSGQASGVAAITEGGYRVSGRWRYATGAPHLTAFTANCRIEEGGRQLADSEGQPLVQAFIFLRDEVEISEDWHTMGLIATAGHSFEVRELHIPADRAFTIAPGRAPDAGPVFDYPFIPFAEATLAVNTLGMTQHFLDICEQLFARRGGDKRYPEETVILLNSLSMRARHELTELREHFYQAVAHSWPPHRQHSVSIPDSYRALGISSRTMVQGCRRMVQELFPYCGMTGADPDTELNRVWRDIFTASQHTLLSYPAS